MKTNDYKSVEDINIYTERETLKKEISTNDSYINWLCEFSKKFEIFYDDTFKHNENAIDKKDLDNVVKLNLLFDIIQDYSNYRVIYIKICADGYYYSISYNNIGFEIGFIKGHETAFFCNRVEIDNPDEFTDFGKIISWNQRNENSQRTHTR